MAHETLTANEKADYFLGGYWKCEDCGLLVEDDLYICPECAGKKTENEDITKRLYVEASALTMAEHEEMIADNGMSKTRTENAS
tara:strand:+ start:1262 stop:1513 length:252 start_codon:yes stop_codon:yes gene_type:complete